MPEPTKPPVDPPVDKGPVEKLVEEKKKEVKKEKTEKEVEAEEILAKVQDILKEHGGLESNIPINSVYWDLLNRYRALQR